MGVEETARGLISAALAELAREGALPAGVTGSTFAVERPKRPEHGDLATNAALAIQKVAQRSPRDVAALLAEKLRGAPHIRSVDIAGTFPYPEDGRRPLLGYSVVETVPDAGTFDQCWVEVWPESPRVQSIAGSAVVVDADAGQGPPTVGQLNSSLGRTFDGEASYRNRATAFLPGALVLVGVSLGFLAVRMRRLELAAARLIGIRPSDQGVMLLMESGAWIAAASIISLVLTLAASVAMTGGLLPSGLEFAVTAVLAGGVGVVCGVLGGVASISSRRALRYFRDR